MTVAVAIAIYNGERFIEEQLDSLLNQSRKPDQVVLCDDCSFDESVEIVSRFVSTHGLEDSWCIYINRENMGFARNFYHACSLCNADIIFLCDQDDVWEETKIEKMLQIFAIRPDIHLLSCKYSVINMEGNQQRGILVDKPGQTDEVSPVDINSLLTSFRWPGMTMAMRASFFYEIFPIVKNSHIPHDFLFALLAAEMNSFWEIDFAGVRHRRHNANAAREEHRVFKNLQLSRKLRDIAEYNVMLKSIIQEGIPMSSSSFAKLTDRLEFSERREHALKSRSLLDILLLNFGSKRKVRLRSLLGDLWLVFFGDYQTLRDGA